MAFSAVVSDIYPKKTKVKQKHGNFFERPKSRKERDRQAKEQLKKIYEYEESIIIHSRLEHLLFIKINNMSAVATGDVDPIIKRYKDAQKMDIPPPVINKTVPSNRTSHDSAFDLIVRNVKKRHKGILHKAINQYVRFKDEEELEKQKEKKKRPPTLDEQIQELDLLVSQSQGVDHEFNFLWHSQTPRQHQKVARCSSLYESIMGPSVLKPEDKQQHHHHHKGGGKKKKTVSIVEPNENKTDFVDGAFSSQQKEGPMKIITGDSEQSLQGSVYLSPVASTSGIPSQQQQQQQQQQVDVSEVSLDSQDSFHSVHDLDIDHYTTLRASRRQSEGTIGKTYVKIPSDLDRQDEKELMEIILSELSNVRREVKAIARENSLLRRDDSQRQADKVYQRQTSLDVLKSLKTADLPNTTSVAPTIIVLNSVTTIAPSTSATTNSRKSLLNPHSSGNGGTQARPGLAQMKDLKDLKDVAVEWISSCVNGSSSNLVPLGDLDANAWAILVAALVAGLFVGLYW